MLPSIELLVFLLIELDVIVIVINRRLLEKHSVFIVVFPFCGGIKRISASTYDYFSSVAVLLLVFDQLIMLVDYACHRYCCIVKIGFELYCLSKPVDVVGWFEFIR